MKQRAISIQRQRQTTVLVITSMLWACAEAHVRQMPTRMAFAMMQTIVWVHTTRVAFAMAQVTFMNAAVPRFQRVIAIVKEHKRLKVTTVREIAWLTPMAMAYVILLKYWVVLMQTHVTTTHWPQTMTVLVPRSTSAVFAEAMVSLREFAIVKATVLRRATTATATA
jgi:hypothetical protein